MRILGDRPSAYGVTWDKFGRKIETEFRQCSHCQASWPYVPGSGHKVGFCMHCMGLLCTRCATLKWKQVDNRCVPYVEGAMEGLDKYSIDPHTGLFMRK